MKHSENEKALAPTRTQNRNVTTCSEYTSRVRHGKPLTFDQALLQAAARPYPAPHAERLQADRGPVAWALLGGVA